MEFISELSLDEYEQFGKQHPLGRFMQLRGQYNMNKQSKKVGCIGVRENGQLVAGSTYFVDHARMGDIYSMWAGPLMDYSNQELVSFFFGEAERFFKQQGALAIRVTPPLDAERLDNQGKVVAQFNQAFVELMVNGGYKHVEQQPVTDNRIPLIGLGYEYRKDLRPIHSVDELRATYSKQARNDIKRAEKLGVYIDRLSYDELPEFKKQTAATAERRSFADKTLHFYQSAYQEYGDDVYYLMARLNLDDFIERNKKEIEQLQRSVDKVDARLEKKDTPKLQRRKNEFLQQIKSKQRNITQAQDERKTYGNVLTLSGGMFCTHPQELAYLFSFNNKQFGNYHGQYLLQDYVMQIALKKHIPTYNFYMVTGNFDGSDGVLKFKQSFGGTPYRTIGWFEKPLKPMLYRVNQVIKTLIGHNDER